MDQVKQTLAGSAEKLADIGADKLIDKVGGGNQDLKDTLSNLYSTGKDAIKDTITTYTKPSPPPPTFQKPEPVQTTNTKKPSKFKRFFKNLWSGIKHVGKKLWNPIKNVVRFIPKYGPAISGGMGLAEGVYSGIKNLRKK